MPRKQRKIKPVPNIPKSLRKVWEEMRRPDDSYLLEKLCDCSQPTITAALLYGFAKPHVAEKINAFYMERIDKELELISKHNQLKNG